MSWSEAKEPRCNEREDDACLLRVIEGRPRDLGGFAVRRLLPARSQQRVGPFIFFDHFGPAEVPPGGGMNVRPHPHIGLATVSYLFEGAVMHRDSVGSEQRIEPGAINWMTAGRGIVHSERLPDDLKGRPHRSHGLQLWVALPSELEETAPDFHHHPAESLPEVRRDGALIRVLVGEAFGVSSPVETLSPTLYCDVTLEPGATVTLPRCDERAAYVVSGEVTYQGEPHPVGTMLVFSAAGRAALTARGPARIVIVGGDALPGERLMWWNLVSSSRRRLERGKRDWKAGRFPTIPTDAGERIELPEEAPHIELLDGAHEGALIVYQQGEELGELTWRWHDGGTMEILHTRVDEALRGGGHARQMVLRAAALAEERGASVQATCPYAARVLGAPAP